MLLWFGSLLFNIGDEWRVSELKKTIIFLQEKLGVWIEWLRVEVPMGRMGIVKQFVRKLFCYAVLHDDIREKLNRQ